MADWVKLDPLQLGEWLAPLRTSRERGEWVTGLQAGALGALLRIGASEAEASGHAAGLALLVAKKDDKEAARVKKSQAGTLGNAKRWGNREGVADPSQCDGFASREGVARDRRGEERRGEENFPQGGNGAQARETPSPIPEWKVARVAGLRRQIEDHQQVVGQLEVLGVRATAVAREKLDAARSAIRKLETEILNLGVPL